MTSFRAASAGRAALAVAAAGCAAFLLSCSPDCCTFDELPISLGHGAAGELLIRATTDDGTSPPAAGAWALLDTGMPVTIWHDPAPTTPPTLRSRTLRVYGDMSATGMPALRAAFRGVSTVAGRLGAIDGMQPVGIVGADVLSGLAVEIGFASPDLTFRWREPASDGFLSLVGYAVIDVTRFGGGNLEVLDPSATFNKDTTIGYSPSRLVLRACAGAAAFHAEDPLPSRCCAGDAHGLATGADLSLLLATGHGPLILSRSAWTRVSARLSTPPMMAGDRPLLVAASPQPIAASWFKVSGLALVNKQADDATDPGPCAELGRARRLEQVDVLQTKNPDTAACALPCDQDPRLSGRALDSAGYLQLNDVIDVAVIDDAETLIQSIRAEVRPEGPEVDGILGSAALASARLELDPSGNSTRAIFSCEAGAGARCRAVGRCPRLPSQGQTHQCFGLPEHTLPRMCDNPATTCASTP